MPNSSRTCKVGETVEISGIYECLNCKYAGVETLVPMEKGKILATCATCKDQDTAWHIKSTS
jgi:hypothetical protein